MEYVLVSQGIEIGRTTDKKEAEEIMNDGNKEWYKYCEWCSDNDEQPTDNEIFMYEEE